MFSRINDLTKQTKGELLYKSKGKNLKDDFAMFGFNNKTFR